MKRLLSKVIALAMSLTAAASVFSGCGKGGDKVNKYVYTGPNDVQYMTFVITNVYWENTESYLRKMKELHPDNKAPAPCSSPNRWSRSGTR